MCAVIGAVARVLVIALLLLVGAMVWVNRARHQLPETATLVQATEPLPSVPLIDDQGREIDSNAVFRDHFTLLFFGYTHCPDVCPLTLHTLADAAQEPAAKSEPPRVLFVSVDARRDTPETIKRYLAAFDPDFVGATAPLETLEPLLKKLGVAVHAEPSADAQGYTVTHSATVFVIDPEAKLAALFSPPLDAHAIARDFERIRRLPRAARRATQSAL